MSELVGKLITCDRCGATAFLRYLSSESRSGGFDKLDYFEKIPNGWQNHYGIGLLCSDCNSEYKRLVSDFMNLRVITCEEHHESHDQGLRKTDIHTDGGQERTSSR